MTKVAIKRPATPERDPEPGEVFVDSEGDYRLMTDEGSRSVLLTSSVAGDVVGTVLGEPDRDPGTGLFRIVELILEPVTE